MSDEMKAAVLGAAETLGKTLNDPCSDPLAQFQPLRTPFFNTAKRMTDEAVDAKAAKVDKGSPPS